MRRIGFGFVGMLFAATTVLASSLAFADVVQPSDSFLYDNGFMNEVLTRRNPSPWNAVRHYVGNKPALIVKILKEQNISLDLSAKYPVGMAVKIPQKYVLKELLPTPSVVAFAIAEAEHQAESQKQANKLFAELKSKETSLVTSLGFNVLLVLMLAVAIMAARSWRNKFVGAEATANAKEREIEKDKDYHRQQVAAAKNKESDFTHRVVALQKRYEELLSQTAGNYRTVTDKSGTEHICLVVSTCWVAESKVNEVSLACPYCSREEVAVCQSDEGMRRHISKNHPERMNPDPKVRVGQTSF